MVKDKMLYPKTRWHRILAVILKEWLTPVGILVQPEAPVGAEPPKADILLLKSITGKMRRQQRQRLADGLRDSRAGCLLLEFKYTESLNEDALVQLLGYELLYKLLFDEGEDMIARTKTPDERTLEFVEFRARIQRTRYLIICINMCSFSHHSKTFARP